MKSKKGLIILIIVLAAVLIGGGIAYNNLKDADNEKDRTADVTRTPEETPAEEEISEETSVVTPVETPAETQDESQNSEPEEESEEERKLAADFEFVSSDGIKARLYDFLGKPVILNFWASWCPPCKGELPDFQDAYEDYGSSIQFLMVGLVDGFQETEKTISEYIADNGYTFPVFMDKTGEAVQAYEIYGIPRTIAVNSEGEIVFDREGAVDAATLADVIEMLLAE